MQATQAASAPTLATPGPSRPALTPARVALIVAGMCFVVYPVLRPFSDEKTLDDGAQAFASAGWLSGGIR